MPTSLHIEPFYDPQKHTLTYVVADLNSRDGVVIDPVLDFDIKSGSLAYHSLNRVSLWIEKEKITLHAILETHAHADHLSGAQELKKRHGGFICIGQGICEVQEVFASLFNLDDSFPQDGCQFDRLLKNEDIIEAGTLVIRVLHTPGHTPACVSYMIDDALFTGDALFMHDYGVGRCDFPKGSASDLYHSIQDKIYALPNETRVFVGHDYQPQGRALKYQTTIGLSKSYNPQLAEHVSKTDFINMRESRDQTLNTPALLLPSIQVNIRAGSLPKAEENGVSYLKIPLAYPE